jgi:hypothetical protein
MIIPLSRRNSLNEVKADTSCRHGTARRVRREAEEFSTNLSHLASLENNRQHPRRLGQMT